MSEKKTSQDFMEMEARYGAHNYHPLPVVLAKGKGARFGTLKEKSITTSCQLIRLSTRVTAIRQF